MKPAEARAAVEAAILNGMRVYAPDEVEMYGRDEAEMIADYVVPVVARAVAEAVAAEREGWLNAKASIDAYLDSLPDSVHECIRQDYFDSGNFSWASIVIDTMRAALRAPADTP